jgi:hypothetical protein
MTWHRPAAAEGSHVSKVARILEGAERAALHNELRRLLDVGAVPASEWRVADLAAAELALQDPSVLADKLGSRFGPRLTRRGDGAATQFEASETSGTWCMVAAKKMLPRLLEVAFGAGIGPDDPEVFIMGGLLSHEAWIRDRELLQLALRFGASHTTRLQPVPHSNHWRPQPAQFLLAEVADKHARHAPGSLPSIAALMDLMVAGARVEPLEHKGANSRRGAQAWRYQGAVEALTAISSNLAESGKAEPHLIEWLGEELDLRCGSGSRGLATEFAMRLRLAELAESRTDAAPEITKPPARRARMGV